MTKLGVDVMLNQKLVARAELSECLLVIIFGSLAPVEWKQIESLIGFLCLH
jgi:hypothetical protein